MKHFVPFVVIAVAGGIALPSARADVAPFIAGPTYDPSTQSGYTIGPMPLQFLLSTSTTTTAGEATAFGGFGKTTNGTTSLSLPVQWTGNGVTEFAVPSSGAKYVSTSLNSRNTTGAGAGAYAVSNTNAFIGSYLSQAARWSAAGRVTLLDHGITAPIVSTYASQINNAGTTVGTSRVCRLDAYGAYSSTYTRPVRWAAGTTTATPLGLSSASGTTTFNSGDAAGISTDGITYGTVYDYQEGTNYSGNFGLTAVRWATDGTTFTELGHATAPAGLTVEDSVSRVRPTGIAIGGTYLSANGVSSKRLPTRWDAAGNVTVLDLPSNAVADRAFNRAFDLNDAGTVIGMYATHASDYDGLRPARWDAGTSAVTPLGLLGTPTDGTSAWALGINNANVAVGVQRAHSTDSDGIAVLWGVDGVAVDLNTFIDPASNWRLVEADSITDSGWVSGVGLFDPDGSGTQAAYYRSFLIQVPEPTMIGAVGVGMMLTGRRRRA